jgi:2-desacetyl-2-hydroxyethyl bacteriochlorophyllide A dehydrogenase
MKAIKYLKPGLALVDTPEPQITRPDEVKIKIDYASICASDIHLLQGHFDLGIPEGGCLIGHESAGTIIELGPDVNIKGLKTGDKVMYYFNGYCGSCFYCRSGREQLCEHIRANAQAMSEYVVCSEQQVHKLPDNVSTLKGCIAEPVSVCLHGVDLMNIQSGTNAAVYGAGGIGLIMLQLIQLAGVTNITVIEPVPGKRVTALSLGADHVLDPTDPEFSAKVGQITAGRGFQAIMEASGSPMAAESAFAVVARGGTIVYFSLYPQNYKLQLDMLQLFWKEVTIRGVFQSPYVFPRVMNILPRLNLDALTAMVFPIDDVEGAFAAQKSGLYPKIVFKVSRDA